MWGIGQTLHCSRGDKAERRIALPRAESCKSNGVLPGTFGRFDELLIGACNFYCGSRIGSGADEKGGAA